MVTNSAHFVSSNETILDNEITVSFDVESLFTNVPIDAAEQAALQKLENDPNLADRTRWRLHRSLTFWPSYWDPYTSCITDRFTSNGESGFRCHR